MSDTITGKIIHISPTGWGFISSPTIQFTRIFFHWTGLVQNTLNFAELKKYMEVEFICLHTPERGWRAIKIRVIVEPDVIKTQPEIATYPSYRDDEEDIPF